MQTNFLALLGAGLGIVGLLTAGFCLWQINRLNRLKKDFFTGASGKDLESVINQLAEGLHVLQNNQTILEKHIKNLRQDFGLAVQKVGVYRFNSFEGGGGNFSFCLALLDGRNTGVLVTSMHGRENNRIYTKQITEGKCEIQLTQEELKAIELAESQYKNFINR